MQWHLPLIRHYINLWHYNRAWPKWSSLTFLFGEVSMEHFATSVACKQRTLPPPHTWSCTIWDLHMFEGWHQCLQTFYGPVPEFRLFHDNFIWPSIDGYKYVNDSIVLKTFFGENVVFLMLYGQVHISHLSIMIHEFSYSK